MKWFCASLFVCGLCLSASGQIRFRGVLLKDANTPRPVPVSGARVVVAGVGGKTTAPGGRFDFDIPSGWPGGKTVLITVHKAGYVINEPVDGEWNLPSPEEQDFRRLRVVIVPRGSKKLWSNLRIETYVRKLSDEAARLSRQVSELRAENSRPKPVDFTPYFKEWANKTGLTPEEIKGAFDEWARSPDNPDSHGSKALKEFYRGNYVEASKNFKAAGDADIEAAKRLQRLADQAQRLADQGLLKGARNIKRSAASLILAYEFEEALKNLEEAGKYISAEKHPDEWADLLDLIGVAKKELGVRREGAEGVALLSGAAEAQRRALEVAGRAGEPELLARIENNLGATLYEQSIRAGGEAEKRLLEESEAAFRRALGRRGREGASREWATEQSNLGWILTIQGSRVGGQEGQRLLGLALDAYRSALEVQARQEGRVEWAHTQGNMAGTLLYLGMNKLGEEGARLLGESAAGYRRILEVFTREKYPELWARTQSSLGWALSKHAQILKRGPESDRLMSEAMAATKLALEVQTQQRLPEAWAATKMNLAGMLYAQAVNAGTREGALTDGGLEEAASLLKEAAGVYTEALAVNTREHFPQRWAMIQSSLGGVFERQSRLARGDDRSRLARESAKSCRRALEVFTRERQMREWVAAQDCLGRALYRLGLYTEGAERSGSLNEAVAVYTQVLERIEPSTYPEEWKVVQADLARAYSSNRDWPNAAQAYDAYSREHPAEVVHYLLASHIYRNFLFDYAKAYEAGRLQWIQLRPNPAALADSLESYFTAGRFDEFESRSAGLLADGRVQAFFKVRVRAVRIANLLALGRTDLVPAAVDALLADMDSVGGVPSLTPTHEDMTEFEDKDLDGVLHFIARSEPLAPHRARLRQFFGAMKKGDYDGVVKALRELRDGLRTND